MVVLEQTALVLVIAGRAALVLLLQHPVGQYMLVRMVEQATTDWRTAEVVVVVRMALLQTEQVQMEAMAVLAGR
jgi:hypothetical protein